MAMRQHSRLLTGAVAVAIGLVGLGPTLSRAATSDDAGATAVAVAARNESLRRELELAEGDAFYLLLEADASVLTLMYKGTPLRETRILSAELGEPRARRGKDDDGAIDLHATWSGGSLEPPRIDVREEVVPPSLAGAPEAEGGAAGVLASAPQGEFLEGEAVEAEVSEPVVEEVEIPKTPEELYPVPASYDIRFAEGLTIEVVRAKVEPPAAADAASGTVRSAADGVAKAYPAAPGPSLWDRLGRFARRVTLARPEGERVRLRVVIDPLDADRLFRSLPPDVKLLIRRPAPAGAES
jgi:hypothetical protein